LEVKQAICLAKPGIAAADVKLIYAGRILENSAALATSGFQSGNTVHMVVRKAGQDGTAGSGAGSPLAAPTPAAAAAATSGMAGGMASGMFGGLGGMFGAGAGGAGGAMGGSQEAMQRQMLENPEQMQAMLDNPMVQSLMENPDVMREMMMANPQVRAMIEQNPEMERVLLDPATMRQTMAMARNPALRDEMIRNQDRAMANISSMPGGQNMLAQMHNQYQAPLMDADAAPTSEQSRREAENPFIALLRPPASRQPNTAPLASAWASSPPPANGAGPRAGTPGATGAGAANPFAGLFGSGNGAASGGTGAPGTPGATGAGFGGMGGMGGMPGMPGGMDPSQMDPERVAEMMENPMFRGKQHSARLFVVECP
jgi:ubiquilin